MNKEQLEAQRILAKEQVKIFIKKIKDKQKELADEKEYYSGFCVHIEGHYEKVAIMEAIIEAYIAEKIRFEKLAKKLKHQIEEYGR